MSSVRRAWSARVNRCGNFEDVRPHQRYSSNPCLPKTPKTAKCRDSEDQRLNVAGMLKLASSVIPVLAAPIS